jgi:hypothetical protein
VVSILKSLKITLFNLLWHLQQWEDGISPKPVQRSTEQARIEGHRGKSLSCGNNYFHGLVWNFGIFH